MRGPDHIALTKRNKPQLISPGRGDRGRTDVIVLLCITTAACESPYVCALGFRGSRHLVVSICVLGRVPAALPAQAVIYAATCDWDADKRTKKDGSPLLPHEDLRYYARGVFSWPQVRTRPAWPTGPAEGWQPCKLRRLCCDCFGLLPYCQLRNPCTYAWPAC